MWQIFFNGIRHITDFQGYDHMLFLVVLGAPFSPRLWKQLAILATAFTVGHSISLALAVFDVIRFRSGLVELLIAVTIMITAIFNIAYCRKAVTVSIYRYMLIAVIGLIHGLGFSSFFRMMLNDPDDVTKALLIFNLGVETGQLLIIAFFLLVTFLFLRIPGLTQQRWNIALSSVGLLAAIMMAAQRI